MQTALARATHAYQQTHVQSRSPLELVVMLYDGALRFVNEARAALDRQDLVAKREALSRALAIVAELQNTLNMRDGGDVATQLDALYTYVNTRLLEANMQSNGAALDEVVKLLTPLREAWGQIATEPEAQQAAR
ncbi:MAG: flagellar export chaperone FliS [Vicinamibacterales bacterium]|nr:flagellar export chaperone FliS [Vicinamibacterales bacterium]